MICSGRREGRAEGESGTEEERERERERGAGLFNWTLFCSWGTSWRGQNAFLTEKGDYDGVPFFKGLGELLTHSVRSGLKLLSPSYSLVFKILLENTVLLFFFSSLSLCSKSMPNLNCHHAWHDQNRTTASPVHSASLHTVVAYSGCEIRIPLFLSRPPSTTWSVYCVLCAGCAWRDRGPMCGAQGSKQINKQTKNHPEKFGNMSRILVTAELIFFSFFFLFFFWRWGCRVRGAPWCGGWAPLRAHVCVCVCLRGGRMNTLVEIPPIGSGTCVLSAQPLV